MGKRKRLDNEAPSKARRRSETDQRASLDLKQPTTKAPSTTGVGVKRKFQDLSRAQSSPAKKTKTITNAPTKKQGPITKTLSAQQDGHVKQLGYILVRNFVALDSSETGLGKTRCAFAVAEQWDLKIDEPKVHLDTPATKVCCSHHDQVGRWQAQVVRQCWCRLRIVLY